MTASVGHGRREADGVARAASIGALDVVISKDQDRTRLSDGLQDLAILRHMALNAMRKEGKKGSRRGKIRLAGWDAFLAKLLDQS